MSNDKKTGGIPDTSVIEGNHDGQSKDTKVYNKDMPDTQKATLFTTETARDNQKKSIESRKNNNSLRETFLKKGGLLPEELLYAVMNDENANIGQRMRAAEKLIDFTQPKLSSVVQKTTVKEIPNFVVNKPTPEEIEGDPEIIVKYANDLVEAVEENLEE